MGVLLGAPWIVVLWIKGQLIRQQIRVFLGIAGVVTDPLFLFIAEVVPVQGGIGQISC